MLPGKHFEGKTKKKKKRSFTNRFWASGLPWWSIGSIMAREGTVALPDPATQNCLACLVLQSSRLFFVPFRLYYNQVHQKPKRGS